MKQLSSNTKQFVQGIVEHLQKDKTGERQSPKVKSLLKKVSADAWNDQVARVTTAVTLTQKEQDELIAVISKRVGHPVTLECRVKPEIIGGIRVEIADFIIDLSFEEELKTIGSMLAKGSRI